MGTDLTVFANHAIDFSSNNFEIIACNINAKLNNSIIINRPAIKSEVRSYYDWQGYDDETRENWHSKIDNCIDNDWTYFISNDFNNYTEISFFGPFGLNIDFTDTHIQFHDPGCRYDSFFGMDKKHRSEWRRYYYQYIKLFNGSFAIYLPDQGDVAWEFTEKIWDNNLNLDIIVNGLLEKYGSNNIGIDDFVDAPYYFVDKFEDIK